MAKGVYLGEDAVAHTVRHMYIGIPTFSRRLGDIAEGEEVLINEDGAPVPFYVACHNYESELNGAGRTLLVRKDCYVKRAWHSSAVNAYSTSTIDAWLNETYRALLDISVQNALGETQFEYTPGNGTKDLSTLSRAIFLLSLAELGLSVSASYANVEGEALPIASTIKKATLDGATVAQWTRTPRINGKTNAYGINSAGSATSMTCNTASYAARPAFTLPEDSDVFLNLVSGEEYNPTLRGIAHTVKKGYIGDENGIARQFFPSEVYVAGTYWVITVDGATQYNVDGTTVNLGKITEFVCEDDGTYTLELHGGGGGGGGYAEVNDTGQWESGDGGYGGSSGALWTVMLEGGKSYPVSIGKGGRGGDYDSSGQYAQGEAGTDGGDTTFGDYSITGGEGGEGGWANESTGSGGDYGAMGTPTPSAGATILSKKGSSSYYYKAGSGGSTIGTYGNGGNGGSSYPADGSDGEDGAIILRKIS